MLDQWWWREVYGRPFPLEIRRNKTLKRVATRALGASLALMLLLAGGGAYDSGSKVEPEDVDIGDVDIGLLLNNLIDPRIAYWDIGVPPGVYDAGDVVYLDIANNGLVDAYDIRLTIYCDHAAGSKVLPSDNDINAPLKLLSNLTEISYMDLDGIPGYNQNDSVYIHINTTMNTHPNDIRLVKVGGLDAGTRVLDFHEDNNMPLSTLLRFPVPPGGPFATIRFNNANGNFDVFGQPAYDLPDVVYIDCSTPGAAPIGFVIPNDIRLSL